jgi:hypothetical protein
MSESEIFSFPGDPDALAKADRISARREGLRTASLAAVDDPDGAAARFVAHILDDDLYDNYTDVQACKVKLSAVPGIWADEGARARLQFYDSVLDLIRNKGSRHEH